MLLLGFPPGLAYPQGMRGGTITFALYQEPELLNRYIGTQTSLSEVTIFTVEGLVDYNDKGEYFPRLATEVPTRQNGGVSADGKSITYHLRDGLKWSDGQPVTCEDVKFTWQAVSNPKSGAAYTS
ncbi:MAG TPA: ABC transporter substrate-binding protein, partial [bacterium]